MDIDAECTLYNPRSQFTHKSLHTQKQSSCRIRVRVRVWVQPYSYGYTGIAFKYAQSGSDTVVGVLTYSNN